MRILKPGAGLDPAGELAVAAEGEFSSGEPRSFRLIITKTAMHSAPLVERSVQETETDLRASAERVAQLSASDAQALGFELISGSHWQRVLVAAELAGSGGVEEALFRDTPTPLNRPERSLRVFLCHASEDRSTAEQLYDWLEEIGLKPWLDKRSIVAGQDWELTIQEAVHNSHLVVVLLSKESVAKEGFVQKELRMVLDKWREKPEGTIFIVPIRLDDCDVPRSLREIHYVDYFGPRRIEKLSSALELRSRQLGISFPVPNRLAESGQATPGRTEDPEVHAWRVRLTDLVDAMDLVLRHVSTGTDLSGIELAAAVSQAAEGLESLTKDLPTERTAGVRRASMTLPMQIHKFAFNIVEQAINDESRRAWREKAETLKDQFEQLLQTIT